MRITYRITVEDLYNGRELPSTRSCGDEAAYNPVALAMNRVHGRDSAWVKYDQGRLVAELDEFVVPLPVELVWLVTAHARHDRVLAQPCAFTIEYGKERPRSWMGEEEPSEGNDGTNDMWLNDGTEHAELRGDRMCRGCADRCAGTEEDPHPGNVPGWKLGDGAGAA